MRDSMIGHTWQLDASISPCLVSAIHSTRKHAPSPSPSVGPHTQPFWVLDYSITRYGLCRVGSVRKPWRERLPHVANLYPPGVRYWEDTRKERGYGQCSWLLFSGDGSGLQKLINRQCRYARFLDADGRLGDLIHRAAHIGQQRGEGGRWQAQAILCQAMDLLTGAVPQEHETYRIAGSVTSENVSDFVHDVQDFLKEHLTERIALHHLAGHMYVSTSALSHRYRKEAGETPMTTLHRLRMDHARALLLRGNPLKVIADQLGFSDAFHLSKTFKRVVGMSPREYLKRFRLP